MPVEEIIKEIKRQDRIIDEAQAVKRGLYEQLANADADGYDWITVQTAAKILGVSVGTVYSKINSGALEAKRIASSLRVRKSEVVEIDDSKRS